MTALLFFNKIEAKRNGGFGQLPFIYLRYPLPRLFSVYLMQSFRGSGGVGGQDSMAGI
jgi:hypothetical protein